MLIEDQLIALTREMESLRGHRDAVSDARREEVRELIKTIGRTAVFFGGFDAMKKLHDACELRTGLTNEIGNVLNHQWDQIGGWCS